MILLDKFGPFYFMHGDLEILPKGSKGGVAAAASKVVARKMF